VRRAREADDEPEPTLSEALPAEELLALRAVRTLKPDARGVTLPDIHEAARKLGYDQGGARLDRLLKQLVSRAVAEAAFAELEAIEREAIEAAHTSNCHAWTVPLTTPEPRRSEVMAERCDCRTREVARG